MDAFYASVEQRDFPELRGKPIAVGGAGGRGVVATCSYEARKYGVRSAMPGRKALRLCPQIIFQPPRFEVYKEVSMQIREVFARHTPIIEPLSLDEAYLDVAPNLKNLSSAREIAKAIREEIFKETQLTASAGISYCKFLAKIGSDMNKPNGQTLILPSQAQDILENLPVRKFFGIGEKTAESMERVGIHTGKDLKTWSKHALKNRFGKAGEHFYHIVRGEDDRPVQSERKRKSISIEDTFPGDIEDPSLIIEMAKALAQGLFERLKPKTFLGKTLHMKFRYSDFQTLTRSLTRETPFETQAEILEACLTLVEENLNPPSQAIRLLGFGISNPIKEDNDMNSQLSLSF